MSILKVLLSNKLRKVLFAILFIMLIWTIFNPFDRYMWFANFLVAILYFTGFVAVDRKVHFSDLPVILLFIHLVIILFAAKYTYEYFEPFNWLKVTFSLNRNYFDRLGHFFQGVTPVILMREIFLKGEHMKRGKFFFLTLVMFSIGISGAWELLEFIFADVNGKTDVLAEAMQGDFWDAQQDMLICTIGSILSLILLSKRHDRGMEETNE